MRFFAAFFLITLFVAQPGPLAKTQKDRKPASFQYTLTNSEWIKQMSAELPLAFCDNREYFGQCFEVEQKSCQKTVSQLTKTCLKDLEVPKSVRLATAGLKLGHRLGRCIGARYEKNMLPKKKKDPICTELKQWL